MCMKRVPQIAVETPACTECHGATVMQRIQGKYGREYRVVCLCCGKPGPISMSPKIAARLFARELHRDIEPPIYGYSRRKV